MSGTVIGTVGDVALMLAAMAALAQTAAGLAGHRSTRAFAFAHGMLALAALCVLSAAFVLNDFSVRYVGEHSSQALPLGVRWTAVWSGHEGSLLLWSATLGLWCLAAAGWRGAMPPASHARQLGVLGLVAIGMLTFLGMTADPFAASPWPTADGRDLQPLLQHAAMAIHPPLLYLGSVGLAVPFAFAVVTLLEGRFDTHAAHVARRFTTVAWCCLTVGIVMGSLWAYEVLGWGGWWFWDPVENASLMPWLVATALLHALAASTRRPVLLGWSLLLAILGFSLTLLGTFVVRSGVLSSVHAFANDAHRGIAVLALLALLCGGALLLHALRAPRISAGEEPSTASRRDLLMRLNGVLLVAAMLLVLFGTLYPLIDAALGAYGTSVGPAYFERVLRPVMVLLMLLLGGLPVLLRTAWRPRALTHAFAAPFVVAALLTLTAAVLLSLPVAAIASLALAAWVVGGVLADAWQRGRRRTLPSASTLAMWLAHLGVATFAFGLGTVKALEVQRDLTIAVGETVELGGYRFRLHGFRTTAQSNYDALQAGFEVQHEGSAAVMMLPEKRIYRLRHEATTVAAIDRQWTRDVVISLGEPVGDRAWSVRLYVKPFIGGLWVGGLMMAAGGVLAVLGGLAQRRRRVPSADAALDTLQAPPMAGGA